MSTENSSKDGKYYTDTEIAGMLGITLGRLRNKLCAGSPLPPRIQPPGCRNRLWPYQAVHDWLEQFTVTVADSTARNSPPRRRGRPTKQEARSKQ